MQDGPLQRYRRMVVGGELAPNTAQELAAEKLQLLATRLSQYGELGLGKLLPFARRRRSVPDGLYLCGAVGRGKTMLLDLFFDSVRYAPKRRVHFQELLAIDGWPNQSLKELRGFPAPCACGARGDQGGLRK
jgi:cell division protein ZapE